MYYKVRIKKQPKAQSGLEVKMRAGLGFNANQLSWPVMAGEFSEPDLSTNQTLKPIPRDLANLEAEVGETAVTNLNADGIPEHYRIGGKRHYDGGTPLNLPDHSYIFSRDNSMKIKDKDILLQFGITNPPKGGVTPAEIAKKYDLNKYKKVLLDKNSDDLSRSTAEMMIKNYTIKLGKLAIVQESMKGFPEGLPQLSMAYLESVGIKPEEILPKEEEAEQMGMMPETEEDQMQDPETEENPYQDLPEMQAKYGRSVFRAPSNEHLRLFQGGGGTTLTPYSFTVGSGQTAKTYNVSPPLTNPDMTKFVYDLDATTTDYDPRLSDESNKKFNQFRQAILDNPDAQDKIWTNYKTQLDHDLANGKISRTQYYNILKDKPTIVNEFMNYQKQNWALADADEEFKKQNGISFFDKSLGQFDARGRRSNETVKNILKTRGFTDADIKVDPDLTRQFQITNFAVAGMMKDPALADKYKNFTLPGGGRYTDPGNVRNPYTGQTTFSPSDEIYGDDTSNIRYTFMDEEAKKTCMCKGVETPLDSTGKCPCEEDKLTPPGEIPPVEAPKDAPWWIQDVIRTSGAIGEYAKIKKYMPWQAKQNVDYIEPTFYSPERELAANAEQLAIGAQGAAQFAGPQSYNARFAQLSGKAAANAADIMGRYNNLNVGVANETEKMNVDIFNRYAATSAKDATMLYDKGVIANQQFDASKAKGREKIGNAMISGITNASDAYNLNQLYPDFAIDPRTGGRLMRKPPSREATPQLPQDYAKEYSDFVSKLPANTTAEERAKIWGDYKGKITDSKDEEDERRKQYLEMLRAGYPKGAGDPGYGYFQYGGDFGYGYFDY